MSVKYLCCPREVIPLQKCGDFLQEKTEMFEHCTFRQMQTDGVAFPLPFLRRRIKPDVLAGRICMEKKS